MAINRLGNLIGQKKHTTYLNAFSFVSYKYNPGFSPIQILILFYFERSATVPMVIILGRLPFVRDFAYRSISVTEFCHKSTISSLSWSLVKLLKIKVMPILYIDCLDCKMTTLNAPLHSKAYNFSKRIYNLYLCVWWHQVKTGWLGEQARWSEFCVLISYQVCCYI